jgi:hypothetical protein
LGGAGWLAGAGLGVAAGLAGGWVTAVGQTGNATDFYTFTNNEGKTVVAQIVNVVDDTVYLKRQDGQSFQVPISEFIGSDQASIRWWAVQEATQDGAEVFKIVATPSKGKETFNPTNNQLTWDEGFTVKLTNETPLHLVNPVIHYILLTAPQFGTVAHVFGNATLAELPANGEATFETSKSAVVQYGEGPGHHDINNQVLAVWVRIYDSNNQLVQEWCSSLDLMKSETWDYPTRTGRRQRPAPPPTEDAGGG